MPSGAKDRAGPVQCCQPSSFRKQKRLARAARKVLVKPYKVADFGCWPIEEVRGDDAERPTRVSRAPAGRWCGYVVEAVWPDGTAEQLPRVYVRAETAMAWIANAGIGWLAKRFPRYH
jgi:hypothetical protein